MRKSNKTRQTLIAFLLTAILVLGIVFSSFPVARAVTEGELRNQIGSLQGSAASLKTKMKEVNKQIEASVLA